MSPDHTPERPEVTHFIERFGVAAEAAGWTRIAGKMLAYLIICQPSEQAPPDLQEALMISKASVSTVGQFLLELGFIERCSRPGDRKTYLRVAPGVWGRLLARQLGGVARFEQLAEDARKLVGGKEPAARARAEEMAMFYRWWAAEAPGLIARWDAFRTARNSSSPAVSR